VSTTHAPFGALSSADWTSSELAAVTTELHATSSGGEPGAPPSGVLLLHAAHDARKRRGAK
jgi:hypothetical protein